MIWMKGRESKNIFYDNAEAKEDAIGFDGKLQSPGRICKFLTFSTVLTYILHVRLML